MSLDRSWLRRGLVGPPHFGRTLPAVWLDSSVTFSRTTVTRDGYASFSGGAAVDYLTSLAHVRRNSTASRVTTSAGSQTRRRRLDIRIPYPADKALYPVKGDHAAVTIDTGEAIRMEITDVRSPREFSDHLHIVCEEYD